MSEDTPTPVKDAGQQSSALHEQKQSQQLRQQQQAVPAVAAAPMQQHDQHHMAPAAPPRHAGQHNLPQMPPSVHGCDRPGAGLMFGSYGPAPAATRSAAAAGTAAASRRSTLGVSAQPAAGQLALPSAYSRLSIAGDTMADAQRQHDQCAGPAAAGAAVAAWAGHRGNNAVRPDVDVAKLRAQVDQHLQVQPLSVEPVLPPNLKRLRTSSVDKLKQSGAPGEDLSTFIPTPTWGSPRVAELQPTAVGGGKPSCSKKLGTGLVARAAHAAGLLAQAAANSAARSSSLAPADVLEPEQQQQHPEDGAGTSMALDGGAAADADAGGGALPASVAAEAEAGVEADDAMDITAAAGMPAVEAGVGAEVQAVSPGLQPVGAAAGALEALPSLPSMLAMGQQLELRPSGQLSTLLPQRRSDDELAVQYRLELQQLKAEHAALQMLTQHTEQETRPPVMGHEPVLPTPGVPRSLESEAERLAARVLKQSGGDWQASMSAMMELLRSNMQQGSQLLRGCNKAAHTAAAEGPHQAADHTSSMGMDLGAAAVAATATPAAAAAAATGAAAGGPTCFGAQGEAAPAVSPCLQLEPQAGAEGSHGQAQEQQQQQQLAGAGVGANDAQPQRRRRQRWFPCLDDQGDSASQSSCHPDAAAAAAGAALTNEGPYTQQAAAWADMQPAAHPATDLGGTADTAMAMDASGAAVVAAAALFSDLVPAAGSRHGSPMRSAAVDSGYHSPAVSSAAGPSPFSAGCGSAVGPSAAGNGLRSRTLTRRQSRLAPKPQAAAAAADMGMALGLAAVDAAAFDAAAAAATAAVATTEPELQDVAAAADAGGHAAHVGVTRSRARKSPPATTPQPQQPPPADSCLDDDDDPISRHLMQSAQAVAAAAGAADVGALQMHQQAVDAMLPGSLPGPLGCPDATGGQVLTCSAAAAAAAFAAGATWAPHWEQQAPQQAAAGAPRGGHRGLTVDTDCGPLDDESWICAGLLDTPGPAVTAGAAAGCVAAAAGCVAAAAGQHGPAGTHLPHGTTPPMGSAAGTDGDAAGTGPGKGHEQQQQQMLQHQMQYHMQYELCAMQQMQAQMQMMPDGMVAGSYWHPIGTAAMDHVQPGPTHASAAAGAAVGIGPGSVAAAGGYTATPWQQVQGPVMAEAAVGAGKVQVTSEDAFPAYMAPAHMQDHHQMQQLQMQPQHQQQQHVMYHQQVPMSQQMAVPQQHMTHGGVPAAGAAAGAGHAAPAAPVVADQALLNMLLGWTNDT